MLKLRLYIFRRLGYVFFAFWFSALVEPALLAWPNSVRIGQTRIYAEEIISEEMVSILARSDTLLRRSGIYSEGYGRRIYLTQGGWRWKLLSFPSGDAFAISRPLTEVIVVNRSSIAHDRVWNGRNVGGQRTLTGVIAHERAHGLIRSHFGLFASMRFESWKTEGYCDYVANESSLASADYIQLLRGDARHPAMAYFEGRRKVEHILSSNGQSVDALFGH